MTININQVLILTDDSDITNYLPPAVETVRKFAKKNNDIFGQSNHRIWSNAELEEFIGQEFGKEVLNAYTTIIPGAFKADLARYCLVHKFGGWYFDINTEIVSMPDKSYADKDMVLFREDFRSSKNTFSIINAIFYASKPEHPALEIAINQIVENVKNKFYGRNCLTPTATVLMGESVAKYGFSENDRTDYLVGDFYKSANEPRHVYCWEDGTVFAKHKSHARGNAGADPFIKKTNRYNVYWDNRAMYGEKILGDEAMSVANFIQ